MEKGSSKLVLPLLCFTVGLSVTWVLNKIGVGTAKTNDKAQHQDLDQVGGLGSEHPSASLPGYNEVVYMDYNATTPIYPEVTESMKAFMCTSFGNPSSAHVYGRTCHHAVNNARSEVGRLINASNPAEEVIFTSCGTESDNRAIDIAIQHFALALARANQPSESEIRGLGLGLGLGPKMADITSSPSPSPSNSPLKRSPNRQQSGLYPPKPHVVTTSVEHPAVLVYLEHLQETKAIRLTIVAVHTDGRVLPEEVEEALTPSTALVSVMHSNNETGSIQPIKEISRIIRRHNKKYHNRTLLHSDAAQSLGKVSVDVQDLGVDMLTIVGHKYGAPKGISALYVRQAPYTGTTAGTDPSATATATATASSSTTLPIAVPPMLYGGGQERGRRAGTENVMLIAALGEASRLARVEAKALVSHMLTMKTRLLRGLIEAFKPIAATHPEFIHLNGPAFPFRKVGIGDVDVFREEGEGDGRGLEQLPNTVSISFKGIKMHMLMPELQKKVACSAGSACHTGSAAGGVMSPVLKAMRVPDEYGLGTLRISLGRHTNVSEVDRTIAAVVCVVGDAMREAKEEEEAVFRK